MKLTKRLIAVAASAAMLVPFCGCSLIHSSPNIITSQFSDETQEIIEMFGDDTVYFDFTTDDTIRYAEATVYLCKDGVWTEYIKPLKSDELQPGTVHFGIRCLDDSFTIALSEKDGSCVVSCEIPLEDYPNFDECNMSTSWRLHEQNIIPNDEIPLWIIIAGKDELSPVSEDFRNTDCDAGIAFTLTFT